MTHKIVEKVFAQGSLPLADLDALCRKLGEFVCDGTLELEHVKVAKCVWDMRRDVVAPASQR